MFLALVLVLGCAAEHALGGEIKVALFTTFDGKECFLSDAELEKFSGVLGRMKRDTDQTRGKFLPQELVFYYWEYSKADKNLKRQSIDFNSNGRSINWRMSEEDSRTIVSLAQDLLKRAKK